ncbi:conserved exported protein of unknown function [Denitratisoma oestradiolicum]|uniref:Cytochrome c domain-containing protein n=2 Tax=Denitratisoma oestradiolicum TaxID=311182 RepID=A0A6S6XS22_9PROT|nr:conserved exported protein of unknown function [Denitratisoma oestradiolicum]
MTKMMQNMITTKALRRLPMAVMACVSLGYGIAQGAGSAFAPGSEEDAVVGKRGAEIFAQRCATCHDHPQGRIPPTAALAYRGPDSVVRTLSHGAMKPMAAGLGPEDFRALAAHLTGRQPGKGPQPTANLCAQPGAPVRISSQDWPMLEKNGAGERYQPDAGLAPADVSRLKLKWAFAYPGSAAGGPVVAGGRVFLASGSGEVHSLDAQTGCSYWSYPTERLIRRVTVGAPATAPYQAHVFFGDDQGFVYALDASSGKLLWKTQVEDHVLTRITAAPTLSGDQLFVPVSSIEDPLTHDPDYPCCTFRGSVVALDAVTGRFQWKTHTIAEPSRLTGQFTPSGKPLSSPAGAAIWTPLVVDDKRGLIYAATGESYTMDNPPGAYAIMAFDKKTGAVRWQRSVLPGDKERFAYCEKHGYTDCRNVFGFGSPPLLATLKNGRQLLVAGQKYGMVYAMDPDRGGRLVWRKRVAFGGDVGGIMYGMASAEDTVYVPVGDVHAPQGGNKGALVKLDLSSGKTLWRADAPPPVCSWGEQGCSAAQSSSVTLMPGIAFLGSWDGHIRAYRTQDGVVVWNMDTAGNTPAVNGVDAVGGAVSGYSQVLAKGALYVTSGAATQLRPGNALLVFTPDGK